MNIEEVREYCIAKEFVDESFPFDNDTLVFKVKSKMFLLISLKRPETFNVKCDPELAVALREKYAEVEPGYHMSKKLWNTVNIQGTIPMKELLQMIDHSYQEVVKSLPKKIQAEFKNEKI
jgi:predicted DNA-binding protein (MmcQ/YjbR family)